MKLLVQRISTHPNYAKVFHWVKLITLTGGGQIIVQLISLISGIIIIRLLPTNEYALYTMVNTMLGTMTVLADGGITSSVMAQGGKVWQDREKLGIVMVTGLNLRKKFAVICLIFAIPALAYLLLRHGASWITTLFVIVSLIPAFYASLSDTLLEITPKLHQYIRPLQKNQIEASLGRFILTGIVVFVFPFAYIAVLTAGLPRIWANIRLRKMSKLYADLSQSSDLKVQRQIIIFVKRNLPGAIYYCLSGQITVWLISVSGTTNAVAQIGALGRIAAMLGLFTVLFITLISPWFSRMADNSSVLLNRYIQIHLGLLLFGACIVGIVWIFASQVLWILGSEYSQLQSELLLTMIGSCIGLIAGLSFSLCTSRGWAINPLVTIPLNITSIILGIHLFDISSLNGILFFNIFSATIQALINGIYGYVRIARNQFRA